MDTQVIYGAKEQLTPEEDKSPPLEKEGTKCIQGIVGALLYYEIAVDNKLLVWISSIGYQQDARTVCTNKAINQLLDYSTSYPANGILYRSSHMVLCANSGAGFHNKIKGRRRAGAQIFLSWNHPMPWWNGPVLTLAQII